MIRKTLKLFPVGVLVLSLLVITHLVLAAVLGDNQLNISKAGEDAGYPAIAVSQDGQNIGLVWTDKYLMAGAIQGPIYIKMASDGATLDHKTMVDNDATSEENQSLTPDVASDPNEDKMHVVWTNLEWPDGVGGDLFYTVYYASCSTTSGACSEETVHRVNNTDDLETVGSPKVATTNFGGTTVVHVVWQFIYSGDPISKTLIYYSGRKANGTWTSPAFVSSETGEYASHPAIATSTDGADTYVHVAWASDIDKGGEDNEKIRYNREAVGVEGVVTSWSGFDGEFSINDIGDTATHPDYPAIAAISDTVMILWDELKGSTVWPEPADEYYAAYALSLDSGSSFDFPHHFYDTPSKEHLSDHTPGLPDNPLRGSEHAERLQIKATAQLTSTPGITAIIHAVWHETTIQTAITNTNRHDVRYGYFWVGIDGSLPCGPFWCNVWREDPPENETIDKKYGSNPSASYYSMSPDIAVANDEIYVLYMEGKEDGGYDVNDGFIFDVIYNGTVALTEASGVVYLPIILKNSS